MALAEAIISREPAMDPTSIASIQQLDQDVAEGLVRGNGFDQRPPQTGGSSGDYGSCHLPFDLFTGFCRCATSPPSIK